MDKISFNHASNPPQVKKNRNLSMHGMMKKMPGPRAPPRRNRPSLVVICIFTIIAVIFIIIQFITFIIILVIIIMTMFKCLEVIIFFPPEYNRSLVLLHHLPDYDYHGASDDDDDLDDDIYIMMQCLFVCHEK